VSGIYSDRSLFYRLRKFPLAEGFVINFSPRTNYLVSGEVKQQTYKFVMQLPRQ